MLSNLIARLRPREAQPDDPSPALLGLLLATLILGGLLRLYNLDHLLIWHDEVFSLMRVFGHDHGAVRQAIFSAQLLSPDDLLLFQQPSPALGWSATWQALRSHPEHAPLYYLLGRALSALPLEPIVALRGLSAVCGLLLIPASFWLMRVLFGRGLAPWIAAALVAVSPLQLLYAQEARQYALWTLMAVVSSAALVHALRHQSWRAWGLYSLTLTIGLYSHLLFALMLLVHGLYGLLATLLPGTGAATPAQAINRPPLVRVLLSWGSATALALLLFMPWILVVLGASEQVAQFTGWMQRPLSLGETLGLWLQHLTRTFLDPAPSFAPVWLALLPLPLWLLWRALREAPWPALALPLLIALVYVGVVLGPDLLLGGSRSQHPRYALPALLAVTLLVGWGLARVLANPAHRHLGQAALAALLALGLGSQLAILRAETWWTKNFSAPNAEIARLLNARATALVLASDNASGIATGELISLAHALEPSIRLWGEAATGPLVLPEARSPVIALTPSRRLREHLAPTQSFEPLAGSWQWYQLRPSARTQ
ncbi:MAG: glycosyl transferase family 39 [Chromatiaceae bacterium]|nr:glycosyl transferase family 39 [Chromatiaceae bacterium]